MLRSLLFVPGNNPSMLQNADVFGADAVIFDLEDSVHVFEKDNARNLVRNYLERYPALPTKILIRINAIDSPFFEADLLTIVSDKIEKATSVLEAQEIATLERVEGLMFGAEDYCSEMGIKRTDAGTELIYPRSHIAICCKAANIDSIDTPFVDVMDEEGLEKDCMMSFNLGFNGKAAIHPRQVQIINQHFSPAKEQIDWALKVLEAKKEADKKGLGVFSLDGKMIDKPIIERALKIRQMAERFNLLEKTDEE